MFNGENTGNPWCCPDTAYAQPIGHKESKYLVVFRCLDIDCEAKLGVYTRQFDAFLDSAMAHLRDKGKPKKARGEK